MTRRSGIALRRLSIALVLTLTFTSPVLTQTSDPGLGRLNFMLGEWRGASTGQSGDGTIERGCAKILNDRFIECRTTATYPPQEKNKKGEVHVDRAIYSYDKKEKKLRLRQFHGEGFVNSYAETEQLSFVTTEIENIPAGWRARETYAQVSPDSWSERFELAGPGKDFSVYSATTFQRVQPAVAQTKPAGTSVQTARPLWRFETGG